MWIADLIGGVIVLLVGIGVIVFSWDLPYMTEFGPGPSFLPRWIGAGLILCSIAVIVKILKKQDRTGIFFKPRTREGLKMLAIIIFCFLLLPVLGFSIGFAVFSGISMRIMGKHGWLACGLTLVGIGIGIRFVFADWLSIPLPTGLTGW